MLIDVPIHLIYQKNFKILTNCHQRNVYNIFRSGVVASSQFIRYSNSNSMRKTYRNLKETISLVLENQVRPKETLTLTDLRKDLLHGKTHCHGKSRSFLHWLKFRLWVALSKDAVLKRYLSFLLALKYRFF